MICIYICSPITAGVLQVKPLMSKCESRTVWVSVCTGQCLHLQTPHLLRLAGKVQIHVICAWYWLAQVTSSWHENRYWKLNLWLHCHTLTLHPPVSLSIFISWLQKEGCCFFIRYQSGTSLKPQLYWGTLLFSRLIFFNISVSQAFSLQAMFLKWSFSFSFSLGTRQTELSLLGFPAQPCLLLPGFADLIAASCKDL